MKHETAILLKEMDRNAVQTQILLHCAPLIAGIKIANLLIVQDTQMNTVRELFEKREGKFACKVLYSGAGKLVLLVYRAEQMEDYLSFEKVKKMLYQAGYRDFAVQALLHEFAKRFAAYREKRGSFPHEMGLFLGYPPEDVEGFIENNGKNALCTGYWKVYCRPEEKQRLFRGFDAAREGLIRLAAGGICMEDMLKYG